VKEAIVLAGGMGTRLRAVVPDLPKPMAPVAGRPFLDILLAFLQAQGIERVILSTGYKAECIRAHFGAARGRLQIDYCHEDQPLGTGGAIQQALRLCRAGPALVVNGDTYLDIDLEPLCDLWARHPPPIIPGRAGADTARFGRVELHEGRVTAFGAAAQPGNGYINAGCYVLPQDLLQDWPGPASFSFERDYLQTRVGEREFRGHPTQAHFIDIGVPEDYARAQTELAGLWP
jgi:D-glycero-alpha-D-manno-heptose 1-phosphate guanylyltransferase